MFKTQERTIAWVNRARIAQKSVKNDHAWHDFFDLANKCLCLGWYLYAHKFLKLKVKITRILHGPASLLAAGPLNVWKAHNLMNWLRKTSGQRRLRKRRRSWSLNGRRSVARADQFCNCCISLTPTIFLKTDKKSMNVIIGIITSPQ